MRAYTAAQVRAAEAPHLAAGEPLMARAAHALARAIRRELDDRGIGIHSARILLLVGSGDNGGDALFAGSELALAGAAVAIAPLGSRMHEAGADAAARAGGRVVRPDSPAFADALEHADVVVDGVLGTGSAGDPALRAPARSVVERVVRRLERAPRPFVVAVDLTSGLHPDSGETPGGVVLPADLTVTFGAAKAGLLRGRGPDLAGRIEVVDIGIGDELAGMTPALDLPD